MMQEALMSMIDKDNNKKKKGCKVFKELLTTLKTKSQSRISLEALALIALTLNE